MNTSQAVRYNVVCLAPEHGSRPLRFGAYPTATEAEQAIQQIEGVGLCAGPHDIEEADPK